MSSLPAPDEVVLDHVGLLVADMARGAEAFARLGFRLTPLLSPPGDRPRAYRRRLVFTDPPGLARLLPGTPVPALPFMAALAVATEDLRATGAVLAQNGVRAHELDTGILAAAIPGGLAGSICFVADGGVATWLAGG